MGSIGEGCVTLLSCLSTPCNKFTDPNGIPAQKQGT